MIAVNICSEILGFVPVYSEQGNSTVILSGSIAEKRLDQHIIKRTLKSVKRDLARCYALDLKAQAEILRSLYRRAYPLPFYLPDNRVFVPLKLRKARVLRDAVYGYIEIDIIDRIATTVSEDLESIEVIFVNGEKLRVYSQVSTIRHSLYFGAEIKKSISTKKNNNEAREDIQLALKVLQQHLDIDSSK